VTCYDVTPEDAGLPRAHADDLKGGDAAHNAQVIRDMLDGKPGPYRDIVCLNAAAALMVADKAQTLKEGAAMAAAAIDTGAAKATLGKLVDISHRAAGASA